ncbi:cation:proton antiporter regulatory subunit [Gracilibacillus sp. HCP3S3_G5_1]|uniref:cation:proton antiporter regulatory subunit n=1 Tax=unclassified Gracilibacillus TaxID=2625209 RepID=UPI003F8C00EE
MKFNIADLPGVGKKLSFINGENQMMSLIIHHSGKREMYFFEDADDDEAVFSFNMTSEDTKQLASQMLEANLSNMDPEKIERINLVRNRIIVEWIDVKKQTEIAGMELSAFRKRVPDGVNIIGIFRNDDFIVEFETDQTIEENDTLLVVGKKEPIKEFIKICKGDSQ